MPTRGERGTGDGSRGSGDRFVPVDRLSALARALLSDDLGGRDVVPARLANRVTEQADEWAAHGFTEDTVRPWRELPPDAAGYLASRGVDPAVLSLSVSPGGIGPVPLATAIAAQQIPVQRAYELLVLTGEHPRTPLADAPAAPQPPPRAVAPVVFSHVPADSDTCR
ncbi:hypothetical protein [Polymorphospora rubra]|uniref:hypothetical protein n=1 Tax=Polymorphospora rubra TaxID=338584 RepID=UPI0033DF033F